MSVNSWRVLRDNIGIVRYGFFLSRTFQRRKHERICSRCFSLRKGHVRESVTGSAGLYRVRTVWIFPVPEIPEGKHDYESAAVIFPVGCRQMVFLVPVR